MTLTLTNRYITYPYGVLKDVFVRVDELLFPVDFVILDMPEDIETPLLLGRPFLETGKALIDVELGSFTLRFNKERVVLKVFEEVEHQKRKPSVLLGEHDEINIYGAPWKEVGNKTISGGEEDFVV